MDKLALIGGLLALSNYIPLLWNLKRKIIRLNLTTWLIWTGIDIISFSAAIYAKSDILFLNGGFLAGDVLIVLFILANATWRWGKFETGITVASLLCLVIWWQMGPLMALITITIIKYGIAIIPSLRDAYQHPERGQVLGWSLATLGALVTIFAVGPWTMVNSFYPTVAGLMNGAMAVLNLRKKVSS
jgi:hypothetical protein